MPVDDTALRHAAADLIAAARREVPAIGLALSAVQSGLGTLSVETSIGPRGAATTLIVFDDGEKREVVLWSAGS